jgi:SsrA-binding protein
MARDKTTVRIVSENRKARHRYHVADALECGVLLVGTEVKSLRNGHASIGEAYGLIKQGELYLVGATIPEYSHGNIYNHVPTRSRKLLVLRRELDRWHKKVKEKGVTIIPLRIYFKGHLVKVEMALVTGKKLHDKRQDQKTKSALREMDRAMSRRR